MNQNKSFSLMRLSLAFVIHFEYILLTLIYNLNIFFQLYFNNNFENPRYYNNIITIYVLYLYKHIVRNFNRRFREFKNNLYSVNKEQFRNNLYSVNREQFRNNFCSVEKMLIGQSLPHRHPFRP